MPETNEGPAGAVEDKEVASPSAENPLPGFAESMLGFPPPAPAGEPEDGKALDEVEPVKAPEAAAEKVEPAKAEPAAKVEEKPNPASTVKFDGLSDKSKAYWENALKAGHATPEDVSRAREESLYQQAWTRNNQEKSAKIKALQAQIDEMTPDLDRIKNVRSNGKRHELFVRLAAGEFDGDEPQDEPITAKKAAEIVRNELRQTEAEKAAAQSKKDAAYAEMEGALSKTLQEGMSAMGVTHEKMLAYLKAEETALKGVDPILRYGEDPMELLEKIQSRHEKALLAEKVAALEAQVNQRASRQVQASKQSLQPTRRETEPTRTGLAKVMADLGVSSLTDVPGFGWGPNGNPAR